MLDLNYSIKLRNQCKKWQLLLRAHKKIKEIINYLPRFNLFFIKINLTLQNLKKKTHLYPDIFLREIILTQYIVKSQLIMITDNEKGLMIQHFMQQVKTEDLLNIAFMKPFEATLRTNKNDKSVPTDSLPKGLMIAVKSSINDNKYKLERVKPIESQHKSLEDIRIKHLDNYISLLKKSEQKDQLEAERKSQRMSTIERAALQEKVEKHNGLEIGICISMKNEDKKKLKSTLVGVADNIDEMIRSGVSPDDIFVVVAIDGVSNVHPSLYEYFEQFERESQIYLQEDQKLTIRKKYQHQLYHSEIQKDEPLNFSKFLFKKEDFIERIDSKFINVRKKYDQIMRIKKSIENIKKENNKDNDNLKLIVNRLADKQKVIMKKIAGKKDKSVVINEESIMKQLATSQEECNQYINTRQELAYISVYRVPTCSISEECRLKQLYSEKHQMAELESNIDSERLMNDQIDRTSIRESLKVNSGVVGKSLRYVNIFFCIKYKESGKLNSHNWFLNGFCQQLNPRYTVLLDVGVRPYADAIFKMYRHLKVNQNVGAVCGYLRLMEQMLDDQQRIKQEEVDCMTSLMLDIFDIQRAQQIETHYEHFLDKSFQALFKFIHVVPGSFSAYSMKALRPPEKKDDLLKSYFRTIDEKMVTNKIVPSQYSFGAILSRVFLPKTLWKRFSKIDRDSQEQMLYDENTYLSQDRVLCLGIHKNGKDIAFLPNVYAQVQPIKQINTLMQQKRRELNGGMFSFEKVQEQFDNVTQQRQKFLVRFQFLYLSFTKFLTFFAPALLIFAFQFSSQIIQRDFLSSLFASESQTGLGNVIYRTFSNIIIFIYALCLAAIFFFSIHLNAKDKKYVYYAHIVSTVLGVFTVIATIVYIVQTFFSILRVGDSYLQKDYIAVLSKYMSASNALAITKIFRSFLYASVLMIYLPAFTYAFFFGKFGILWEVLIGSPSYIYYFPTYACIMPIYAKCRLDETSSASKQMLIKNQKLKDSWKIVKMIDLAKYLIWNIIVAVLLIFAQSIILVKFFVTLFLLFTFSILSFMKWIPGLIYIIKYKMHNKQFPLEPSQEQKTKNIMKMRFKIIQTIKRFEDDFTFNIKESFQEAAIEAEIKELERKAKLEGKKQTHNSKNLANKNSQPYEIVKNESINANNRLDLEQSQAHLRAKVQNIRESYAPKASFYPFQVGVAKKEPKPVNTDLTNAPLQVVLLRNKLGEAGKNPQHKGEEEKLKKYEHFRSTIKPLGF